MTRSIGRFVLALTLTLAAPATFAKDGPWDLDGRFGFGVGGGIHESLGGASFTDLGDENEAYAAWFRYHLSSAWSLELAYDHFGYDKNQFIDTELKNNPLTLSAGYRAWATERSRFLIQFGLGLMQTSNIANGSSGIGSSDKDSLGMKIRLGYEFMLGQNWALNINADYHYVKLQEDRDMVPYSLDEIQILSPMIGLTYYFGNGTEAAPADTDADGVTDDMDKCPGTVAGTQVGADGCAVKKEAAVVDTDYDGVADSEDKCPSTAMGTKVNSLGCAATEKIEFKLDVKFASGKSEVPPEAKTELASFAEFMTKHPKTTAEIAGHTDNTGKESFNNMISQKRAEAVRQYLITNFKIAKERLTAKGYGPSEPIGDNKTAAGRLANRRVVANVKSGE